MINSILKYIKEQSRTYDEICKYFEYTEKKEMRKHLRRLCREKKIQRVVFSGYVSESFSTHIDKEVFYVP
jgi:predicted HTH transcriptional regulator